MKIQKAPISKGDKVIESFGADAIYTTFVGKKVIERIYHNGKLTRKQVKNA